MCLSLGELGVRVCYMCEYMIVACYSVYCVGMNRLLLGLGCVVSVGELSELCVFSCM